MRIKIRLLQGESNQGRINVKKLYADWFPRCWRYPDEVRYRFSLMDLYVLRHGKAEVFPSAGGKDADRPLTRQGRNEIQHIASWMMRNRCRFTMIATSPLKRAEETAEIVAGVYGLTTSLVVWEELSPGLDFDQLMEQIVSCGDISSLLMIGHEPSLSGCVGRIISDGGTAEITLRKGGLARIGNFCPDPVSGTLVWLLSPRHMR